MVHPTLFAFQISAVFQCDWQIFRGDARWWHSRKAAAQLSPPASTRRPLQPHSASVLLQRLVT